MTDKPRTSKPSSGRARSNKAKGAADQAPDTEKTGQARSGPWWHAPNDPEAAHAEAVGSAADEAARLAGALADFASRAGLADVVRGFAAQTAGGVKAAANKASQTAGRSSSTGQVIDLDEADDVAYANEAVAGENWDQPAELGDVYAICDECPVCLGMEFLRETQPEIAESVAEALVLLTSVAQTAIDSWLANSSGGSRVEHIDLS